MKIALVFPPYSHKIFSENLSTVDEEFCLAPPIILAYVAAILEKHGHKVKIIDARSLNLPKNEVLTQLELFKPDILGFRSETYHFHDALEWIRYLKQNIRVPVITGGVNLSLYPKETLSHPEIDYGIVGEAIESLPSLIRALECGDEITGIPGVAYKKDGNITINPPKEKFIDFDSYPLPARHLLSNDRYYSFISQRKNFTVMLTSVGCPFKCTFCAIPVNYKARTPKNVVDEIEVCYKDFNIREIDFFDAVLFMPKDRILQICRLIKERKLDIEWSARSRVDVIDEEILKEAASAGCRQIYYGIESVNQQVLNGINKKIDPARVAETVRLSKKYGIRSLGFFMVGNPGDTKKSIRESIRFAEHLGLDFIQVCRTIAKPGTELEKVMIDQTGRDYWREHVAGKKIEGRLPTPWSTLKEKEAAALTKEFYLKFYMRPKVILKRIFQIKSLAEVLRYVRVGWKILMQKSELYSNILTDVSLAEEFLSESKKFLQQARLTRTAIVIPTYNEKDNIKNITKAIAEVLPQAHIVVVDDNSPDGTAAVAEKLFEHNANIHVIRRKGKRGLGLAYITGFKFVLDNLDSEYIFEMDADLSHNPEYLPLFLYYAKTYGLVTGSRFLARVSIKNRAIWRNMLSIYSKRIINLLTGLDLTDVTTGFKCFNRKVLQEIGLNNINSKGYAFQIEVSYEIARKNIAIKEIPVLFLERAAGKSKMSPGIILEGFLLILRLTFSKRIKNGI